MQGAEINHTCMFYLYVFMGFCYVQKDLDSNLI